MSASRSDDPDRRVLSRAVEVALRAPLLTIGLWVVLGGLGFALLPSVGEAVQSQSAGTLPVGAPSRDALAVMDKAFGNGRVQSVVVAVFENKSGLTDEDKAAYRDLASRLEARPAYVGAILGDVDRPETRAALTSDDGQAAYLPIGLTSEQGSATSDVQLAWVRDQVREARADAGAKAAVAVTGEPAFAADSIELATSAHFSTGLYSVALLLLILILIYRRPITLVVPLGTIAVAGLSTNAVLAAAGQLGIGYTTFSQSICTAVVLGAGTDYSIFLLSRFREEYGRLDDVGSAVRLSLSRLAVPLLGSAGTVAVSALALSFADLNVFSATGPSVALTVITTALVSLTVTPALLVLLGRRVGPGRVRDGAGTWSWMGDQVAKRPVRVLLAGTSVLLVLAVFAPQAVIDYAPRPTGEDTTESNRGEAMLRRHFEKNVTEPDYIVLAADHDMRNSKDLAVIAGVSRGIAKVGGVTSVRSATQPAGETLDQLQIANQLAQVSSSLTTASVRIDGAKYGLDLLQGGSAASATGAAEQARRLEQLDAELPGLAAELRALQARGSDDRGRARAAARAVARFEDGLRAIASGLDLARVSASSSVRRLGNVIQDLEADPQCDADPVCRASRTSLVEIHRDLSRQVVDELAGSVRAAREISRGQGRVADSLRALASSLRTTAQKQSRAADGQDGLRRALDEVAQQSRTLADQVDALPAGIRKLIEGTLQLADGLDATTGFLNQISQQSDTKDAGGFFLPPSLLTSADFKVSLAQFVSPDGRTARIQFVGDGVTGDAASMARFRQVEDQVREMIDGSTLDGSKVEATGPGGAYSDARDYFRADLRLVLVAVLLAVLLLTMLVLRAVVAPLYLLGSVVLSYGAAIGATVLVFDKVLGHAMPLNVPVLTFVLLVAVGADYNLLLMSRMREHTGRFTRAVAGRAVTSTGPVITAAGVIFASAFVPLIPSSLTAMAQQCFAIAFGLLLDTFVVRSLIVPACAALVGDLNWWPSRASDQQA